MLLVLIFNSIISLSVSLIALSEEPTPNCVNESSNKLLLQAYELQKNNNTSKALEIYKKGIDLDKSCEALYYEIGWSYWKLGEWKLVVDSWKSALKINPEHKNIKLYMDTAVENLKIINSGQKTNVFRKETALFSQSLPKDSPLQLTLIQRWQSYNKTPELISDHYDEDIFSPKSIQFSKNGESVFVHSLEGHKTVVFNQDGSQKKHVIHHSFAEKDSPLFEKRPPFDYTFSYENPNVFSGKPVESVLSHNGKYLWVTYYRRSYDELGQEPSAVSIIDTDSYKTEKVFGTGPISKYIEKSHDDKWMAISNWGDNTVSIYKIDNPNLKNIKPYQLLIVEKRPSAINRKVNRDKLCGFCIRGLAFSKDSKYLFVSRMKGGGISIFHLDKNNKFQYKATVFGIQAGTRDLHLSLDGKFLFAGCNSSGTIAKIPVEDFLAFVDRKKTQTIELTSLEISNLKILKQFIGLGVRSFKLHPTLNYIFSTSNNGSEVIMLKSDDLKVLGRIPVDSYPVGLGISPSGKYLWVSSQGKNSQGGNSVSIFLISEFLSQQIILEDTPQ